MANIKHTIQVNLLQKDGNAQEGAILEIVLPSEYGVNNAHVFSALEVKAKGLGYLVNVKEVRLGNAVCSFGDYADLQWVVQTSVPV